jgi:4-phosphopantoate--beta-alanine ligase
VAAAYLITAQHPVLSVNGNTVALVGSDIARLGEIVPATIEVNLFHASTTRQQSIISMLKVYGAENILGSERDGNSPILSNVSSPRMFMHPEGIAKADVVLVPLEDGDRAEALRNNGKIVIAIDLNPLSRTSRIANVTIVDNITRTLPLLIATVEKFKESHSRGQLSSLKNNFDNIRNLDGSVQEIIRYLSGWRNNN